MGRLVGRALAGSVLAAAFVVVCAGVAGAQAVKGSLVGNIMDQSESALPGVTVTITEVNTNIAYSAVTNESGNYTFSNLKDGTYRVGAELSGFKRVVRDGVEVPVNATVRVDMKLEVGAIEESVTVVGASPLLQTDRADRYPVPDGKLTFDKLSSVFAAGNRTRDDQPNHIRLQQRVPRDVAELWAHMCPADVYAVGAEGDDGLVTVDISPSNCVQCGAISAKGGRLTPPEGGSGPEYNLT